MSATGADGDELTQADIEHDVQQLREQVHACCLNCVGVAVLLVVLVLVVTHLSPIVSFIAHHI
jgi:hypothetical protein